MTGQTVFSLKAVNSLRRAAKSASRFPHESPEGWRKSPVDPMGLLRVFPALNLKPGYVLRAYSFFDGGNGNTVVYVVPEDAPFPEPQDCPPNTEHFLDAPIPPGANERVAHFIEGDGSPWSYMCASILVRELAEFGALWHGCAWSTHTILGSHPAERRQKCMQMGDPETWNWLEPAPSDWRPCVAGRDGRVTVTFYTHTALGAERVIRHVDTYEPGTYRFESEEPVIADGGAGFTF
jgi:hypothetical protein